MAKQEDSFVVRGCRHRAVASDSFTTLALYKCIYLLTYLLTSEIGCGIRNLCARYAVAAAADELINIENEVVDSPWCPGDEE